MNIHRESTGRFVLFRFTTVEACFRAQEEAVGMLDFLGYPGELFIERRVLELSILRAVVQVPSGLPKIVAAVDTSCMQLVLPDAISEAIIALVGEHQEATTHGH